MLAATYQLSLLLLAIMGLASYTSALSGLTAGGQTVELSTEGAILETSRTHHTSSELYEAIMGSSSICSVCSTSNAFTCGGYTYYCTTGSVCSLTIENEASCYVSGSCGPKCTSSSSCAPGYSCYTNTCCGYPVCLLNACLATSTPTNVPTPKPSLISISPSFNPSSKPSSKPSFKPTSKPSATPTQSKSPSSTYAPTTSTCGVCNAGNSFTCNGANVNCNGGGTYCALTIEKNVSCFASGSCPTFTCTSSSQCASGEACFPSTCCGRAVCLKTACPGPTAAPTSRPSNPTAAPTRYPTFGYPSKMPTVKPTLAPTTNSTCGVCNQQNTFQCQKPATYCNSFGDLCALTIEKQVSCMADVSCGTAQCSSSADCKSGEACFTNTCCGFPVCAKANC